MIDLNRKRWILLGIAALVGAAVLAWHLTPQIPRGLPPLSVNTIRGERVDPEELRGKVVLVTFWATTCAICMKKMPELIETHNRLSERGYETLAVAMSYDPPGRVVEYANAAKLPFKVVIDADERLARAWGNVTETPTVFLVDRHGNVSAKAVGEGELAKIVTMIESKLAERI